MLRSAILAATLLLLSVAASALGPEAWDPEAFEEASQIELRTITPEEGEYWFPVWVVVVDGSVYVRLGSRAAERIRMNAKFPEVGVRLGNQQFDRVIAEPAADYSERVAAAMGDKYWSDLLIRWLSHPLTLELVPAEPVAPAAP